MADGNMGFQARMSAAAVGTAIGSFSAALDFNSESLQLRERIVQSEGTRGTLELTQERSRFGVDDVSGNLLFDCSPLMLDILLPWILGANESMDVFAVADVLQERDILIDRVAKRFLYGGCKVDRATFRGRFGSIVQLSLDVKGKSETVSDTAFPSITIPVDIPYIFSDGVITLAGSARKLLDFELSIAYGLEVRYTNSRQATSIMPRERMVTLMCTTPWTADEVDMYGSAIAGAAGSIVLTVGGASCSIALGAVQFPKQSPTVRGKTEILCTHRGEVKKTGSTPSIQITNDSTP